MSKAKVSYDLKRFAGIKRDYTSEQVERLRGSIKIEHTLCKLQSKKLWELLNSEPNVLTYDSVFNNFQSFCESILLRVYSILNVPLSFSTSSFE